MTNDEAIAYFKRHIDLYCVDGICREAEEMAIKILEQTTWIPVSERLPNLDDYAGSVVWMIIVLITGYLSFDDTKRLFVSEAFAKDVICNCIHDVVVIAWMPLPEPYKGE